MTNSTIAVKTSQLRAEDDMFADLEPLSALEVKKDYLATQLSALMTYCGKNRSDMAEELGWKKSRVTQVLSGHNNLTIKTICDFSTHLGYDFDVIFHGASQPRPRQPWQIQSTENASTPAVSLKILNLPIKQQSAQQVLVDLLSGKGGGSYFSFDTVMFGSTTSVGVGQTPWLTAIQSNQVATGHALPVVNKLRR